MSQTGIPPLSEPPALCPLPTARTAHPRVDLEIGEMPFRNEGLQPLRGQGRSSFSYSCPEQAPLDVDGQSFCHKQMGSRSSKGQQPGEGPEDATGMPHTHGGSGDGEVGSLASERENEESCANREKLATELCALRQLREEVELQVLVERLRHLDMLRVAAARHCQHFLRDMEAAQAASRSSSMVGSQVPSSSSKTWTSKGNFSVGSVSHHQRREHKDLPTTKAKASLEERALGRVKNLDVEEIGDHWGEANSIGLKRIVQGVSEHPVESPEETTWHTNTEAWGFGNPLRKPC